VVAADTFEEIVAGGLVSAVVADVNKLATAWFSCWYHFFAAFFEVVSMVAKNGNSYT
jgi:membrane protein required for beta-lactamase induction